MLSTTTINYSLRRSIFHIPVLLLAKASWVSSKNLTGNVRDLFCSIRYAQLRFDFLCRSVHEGSNSQPSQRFAISISVSASRNSPRRPFRCIFSRKWWGEECATPCTVSWLLLLHLSHLIECLLNISEALKLMKLLVISLIDWLKGSCDYTEDLVPFGGSQGNRQTI